MADPTSETLPLFQAAMCVTCVTCRWIPHDEIEISDVVSHSSPSLTPPSPETTHG